MSRWSSNPLDFNFKKTNPDPETRRNNCQQIIDQHPDKVPIICERAPGAKINDLDKTKYLVGTDLKFLDFVNTIRSRLNLEPNSALFLIVGGKHSVSNEMSLGEIYKKYKDSEDGFLYMHYSSELTFG